MKQEPIVRDERYFAVENASYRLGFSIMLFGTLALCAIRAALFRQSYWDFIGLVIISSLSATVYQIKKNILPYTMKTIVLMIVLVLVTSGVASLAIFLIKNSIMK